MTLCSDYEKKIVLQTSQNQGLSRKGLTIISAFNSLPNDKILNWLNLKAFADNKINGKGRKHYGKRRIRWLPAFSPFPIIFSKGFLYRVVKSRDCVVKS